MNFKLLLFLPLETSSVGLMGQRLKDLLLFKSISDYKRLKCVMQMATVKYIFFLQYYFFVFRLKILIIFIFYDLYKKEVLRVHYTRTFTFFKEL